MPKPTINVEELRARFRAAKRVPQLLEVREVVAVAMRQASGGVYRDPKCDPRKPRLTCSRTFL